MIKHTLSLAIVSLLVVPVLGVATPAPTVDDTLTFTGCLQAGDEEGKFQLEPVTEAPEGVDVDAVKLVPAEGVDMAAHVGHTVQVTGEKKKKKAKRGHHAEGHEEGHAEGHEEGHAEGHEEGHEKGHGAEHKKKKGHYLKVKDLQHVSASCES